MFEKRNVAIIPKILECPDVFKRRDGRSRRFLVCTLDKEKIVTSPSIAHAHSAPSAQRCH